MAGHVVVRRHLFQRRRICGRRMTSSAATGPSSKSRKTNDARKASFKGGLGRRAARKGRCNAQEPTRASSAAHEAWAAVVPAAWLEAALEEWGADVRG